MKVKVINKAAHERAKTKVNADPVRRPNENEERRAMAATVKSWIDELNQKRENDRRLINKLFSEEY